MKLLEKQKELKSRLKEQGTVVKALPVKNESNFPSLTVVVQNENRFIQTDAEKEKKSPELIKATIVNKVVTSKPAVLSPNTSLAKKVLVKNAMDSLILAKVVSEPAPSSDSNATATATAVTVKPTVAPSAQAVSSVEGEQKPNNVTESISESESMKPSTMSLEMFAKKTPKIKASILANYVKRYTSHGFVVFFYSQNA